MSEQQVLSRRSIITTRKITYAGALLALSIALPQIVHFTGIPESGKVLLPMHIPVLLAGLILGPVYGLIIGILAPVFSFLISGMPAVARLPFMIIELGMYGLIAGFLFYNLGLRNRRFGIYVSLLIAMIAGRLIYGISLIAAAGLFSIQAGGFEAAIVATTTGIIGVIVQLLFIPPIVYALRKGGQIDAIHGRDRSGTASESTNNAA